MADDDGQQREAPAAQQENENDRPQPVAEEQPPGITFITLHCKCGKDTFSVPLPADATIQTLKEKLHALSGVLPRLQKIIFKGRMLDTSMSLRGASLSDGSKLMMVGSATVNQGNSSRIKGGPPVRTKEDSISSGVKELLVKSRGAHGDGDKISRIPDRWKLLGIISLRGSNQEAVTDLILDAGKFVRILDLGENRLKQIPSDISSLINLQKLHLDANGLSNEQIDWQSLTSLQQLTALNLDNNLLTQVPSELGRLCALKHFSAASNKIESIPEEISNLSLLETLNMSKNCLSGLPSSLGQCSQLIEVDLSTNRLAEVPSSLGNLKNLKVLNLNNNCLKSFPKEILKGCEVLSTLYVRGNELTVECLRVLDGWEEFDQRRRAKHSKQLHFNILDSAGGFDEGTDAEAWHHH